MRIMVSQDDIEYGLKCNANGCPIARALFRGTGQHWLVRPYDIVSGNGVVSKELPQAAINFVYAFDSGYVELTKPFSFYIDIEDNCGNEEFHPSTEPVEPEKKERELIAA